MSDAEDNSPDVVPPPVSRGLAFCWIALFGGRWIGVSLLQWNGVLTPDQVAEMDSAVLSRLYLILLSFTILILALRRVRGLSPSPVLSETSRRPLPSKDVPEPPSSPAPKSRQESRKP